MRVRGLVAAGAGAAGAALSHALDGAGLLPGVHEAVHVRDGMSVTLTFSWLAVAAALAWLAARRGPIRIGAPASLLVAAVPELVGRHDLGAVLEPGAIAGAALQWLLLLAVVAVLVVASRSSFVVLAPSHGAIAWPAPPETRHESLSHVVGTRGRPRAPPDLHLSFHVA